MSENTTRTTTATSRVEPSSQKVPKTYLVSSSKSSQKSTGAAMDAAIASVEGESIKDIDDRRLSDLQEAEILINQVIDGSITVPRLTSTQRNKIAYYLSVFNPLIARIVDLHTKLPLSTMRIQKPNHDIDIVQDYVHAYFQKIFESDKFKDTLEEIIRNFWVIGRGLGRLEDDYSFDKDTIVDHTLEKLTLPEISQENLEKAERINADYNRDPSKVPWDDKKQVIELYLLKINGDYKGLKRYKSVHPLDVLSIMANEDIDYYLYETHAPQGVKMWQESNQGREQIDLPKHPLVKLGYSKGLTKLALEAGDDRITIDSDPFGEEGLYMTFLQTKRPLIDACLESAIYNMAAIKHNNELVGLSSKIDRLISAKDASAEQLETLNESLAAMAEEEQGSSLAVNFEVSVEELSLDVKDLVDLAETIERTNKEIMSATGMPEELVTEGGSYGSGFLKVELLSHEYVEFRNRLKSFIENQILTPIAIKKGFITVDEWGNTVPLIPRVKFDRLSLARSSEDFSQMIDLVLQDKLPAEILYESLGLEVEDVKQKLTREKGTILDESVQDAINTAFSNLGDELEQNPHVKLRLLEALDLPIPDALKQALEQVETQEKKDEL